MVFSKFTLLSFLCLSAPIFGQDSIVRKHLTFTGVEYLENDHWVVALDFDFNQKDSIEVRTEILVNWKNVNYSTTWFYFEQQRLIEHPVSKREELMWQYKNDKGTILQIEPPELVEGYHYLKSSYGYVEFPTAMKIPKFVLYEK